MGAGRGRASLHAQELLRDPGAPELPQARPAGRGFLKWRWRAAGCELPRFDPARFLELVRHRSLAFVGASLARNHMQSLQYLLSQVEYPKVVSRTESREQNRVHRTEYTTSRPTTSPCPCSGLRFSSEPRSRRRTGWATPTSGASSTNPTAPGRPPWPDSTTRSSRRRTGSPGGRCSTRGAVSWAAAPEAASTASATSRSATRSGRRSAQRSEPSATSR